MGKVYIYKQDTIYNILHLLQEMEVKGIRNAGLLFSASEMIRNPLEEREMEEEREEE